ncbi:hypothetical protein A6A08_19255 [Nocardiopsis sp. TSRI0078]|uniref:hypothetical protein n=1 Tax=unclassified Nocardiopsis TaxID=2649073 RepID=UPI0009397CBB|nr:hypothetical protein [Nocardiopsis sp. TSRI0078]OKI22407.1 hypothetical protein A6A08_19255 [Nocardiopsis sp. TSRI0078]
MPSREHEIPLRIIQNQPALAAVLLHESLGLDVPHHTEALSTTSVLTNCDPKELNSDGATLLRDGDRNVLAIVVERQNSPDRGKRASWPAYLVNLHVRLECPAVLVVLCPDEAMARWCAKPISVGHPGFDLTPLVVGPGNTPVITDVDRAREMPELAVLSAHTHGDAHPLTLKAVVEALDATAPRNRPFYYDYVLAGLNEAARKELEGLMSVDTYEWQSDFAREYVGMGREEGREEGRAAEAADNVLLLLDARGLAVSDQVRRRVESCTDLRTLRAWVRRAATVEHAEDLFG